MKYKLNGVSDVDVYTAMPKGWKVDKGATTAPLGGVVITSGGSRFGYGDKQRKTAILVTDKKLFEERLKEKKLNTYYIADKVFTDIEEAKAYAKKIAAQVPHGKTAQALTPTTVAKRSPKSRLTDVVKHRGKAAAQKTGAKVQSHKVAPKSTTTYTVKEGRKSKTFSTKDEAETCARQAKNRNVTITKGTRQPTHRIVKFTAKK